MLQDDLKRHRISIKVEQSAHQLRVVGNRIQVEQVLLNLITNAIEAMATVDGPRVLAITSSLRDGDSVMISVADTGTGIDPQDVQRVFNPLFTTKSGGMGMGLSICRSIIEAHGGTMWVVPNAPRGAIFHLVLGGDSGAG